MSHSSEAAVERMASLTFALLGAAQYGSSPYRTAEWIQRNVDGYPQDDEGLDGAGAFRKQLRRDVALLQEAGVPIVMDSGKGSEQSRLWIKEEEYRLPEVEFTPQESVVLGLAGGLGQQGGLSVFSQTGWTKIAAAGSTKSVAGGPSFSAHNDLQSIEARDFRELVMGVDNSQRIEFTYLANVAAQPQLRLMDPWGIVHRQGRVYVVGWDVERAAPRSFRLTRISSIKRVKSAGSSAEFHVPTQSLEEIVAQVVEPTDLIDAVVKIPEGTAVEIASLGYRNAQQQVILEGVSAQWLARTAIGYAPQVEVLSPPEVRAEIQRLTRHAAGLEGSEHNG